jgi:putative hydrolase of the HAD superfamily
MKAIAFDLWETIITDTPETALRQQECRLERMAEVFQKAGHPVLPDALEAAYRHTWVRCNDLYWSRDRDIPARTQILHMLEPLLADSEAPERLLDDLEQAYVGAAADHLPDLVDGAAELLSHLRRRWRIGLVSNTGRTPGAVLRGVLDRLGVGRLIDVAVFSNEHGECKPEPSIFARLQEGLGVASSDVVFVGDNLFSDVWGAKQAGMRAVHFDPPVRGTAVGPVTREVGSILPDATIRSLRELPPILEEWAQ